MKPSWNTWSESSSASYYSYLGRFGLVMISTIVWPSMVCLVQRNNGDILIKKDESSRFSCLWTSSSHGWRYQWWHMSMVCHKGNHSLTQPTWPQTFIDMMMTFRKLSSIISGYGLWGSVFGCSNSKIIKQLQVTEFEVLRPWNYPEVMPVL